MSSPRAGQLTIDTGFVLSGKVNRVGRRPLLACDDELLRLRPVLEAAGYAVTPLHDAPLDQVDAVLLSRLDSNLMGRSERLTPAVVLHVAGMTPQEVVRQLDERLRGRQP